MPKRSPIPYLAGEMNVRDVLEKPDNYRADAIEWVIFSYGSLIGGYMTVALRKIVSAGKIRIRVEGCRKGSVDVFRYETDETEWLHVLRVLFDRLHIRDWKERYIENMPAADGEQWSVDLWMRDGSIIDYRGINTYPAFWNELKSLFEGFIRKAAE